MSALKVLFIGGSGQISSACSQRAVDLGIDLYVLNRGRSALRPLPAEAHVLQGDIRDRGVRARRHRRPGVRRGRRLRRLHARARAGRHRPVRGPHRPVRLHQLGLGLPEAGRPAADHRVDAAAQPDLALLAGQDRLRGAARARLSRGRLPGDDRAPLAHLRPRQPALRRRLDGRRAHAPGPGGRRARRRHLAVDAHPPHRLRQGLRRPARPPPGDRRQLPHHLRRGPDLEPDLRARRRRGGRRAAARARRRPRRSSPPTRAGAARCSATRPTR